MFFILNHRLIFIVIYIRSAQTIGIQLKIAPAAASGVSGNVYRAGGGAKYGPRNIDEVIAGEGSGSGFAFHW